MNSLTIDSITSQYWRVSVSNIEESLMPSVNLSRMTHQYEGDLVLFLIGMRINKPWRPDLWLPVFRAMPGMLAELARDLDSGFLGSRLIVDPRGPWLVQYW